MRCEGESKRIISSESKGNGRREMGSRGKKQN